MRVAAIDCGTNSLRLLVAEVSDGEVVEVARRSTIVRLGQGIDATGEISPEALRRTFAALDEFAAVLDDVGVEHTRFVATSAARDARNRDEFAAGVAVRVGVAPDVISGQEEAELTYAGASRGIAGLPDVAEPVAVLDIGGGSTELVRRGEAGGVRGESLDVGSVRLTERSLPTDPPTPAEVATATAEVQRYLDSVSLPLGDIRTVVGVAGTATTVAAHALEFGAYDRTALHRVRVPRDVLLDATDDLLARTVAQRMALPFMQAGRADVIGAGALILGRVIRSTDAGEMILSKTAILEGIAVKLGRQ